MASMALRSSSNTNQRAANQENEVFKTKGVKPGVLQPRTQRTALGDIKNRKPADGAANKSNVPLKTGLAVRPSQRATAADAENQVPKREMPLRRSAATRSTTQLQQTTTHRQPQPANRSNALKKAAAPLVQRANSMPQQPAAKVVAEVTPPHTEVEAQQPYLTDDKTALLRPSCAFATQMVYDIDAEDQADPLMVAEYAMDIYDYMRHLESEQCVPEAYLDGRKVTSRMRAILVDWLSQVHLRFHLLPETMYMTTMLVDRYLSTDTAVGKDQLQLIGVACMFIASKYEEIYAPEIDDFVYITDYTYDKAQILTMEMNILRSLNFQLGRPLALNFLRRFSKANNSSVEMHSLAKYLLELQMVEYSLCHVAPSKQAAVALRLAQCLTDRAVDATRWTATLQYHSKYSHDELLPAVKVVARLLQKTHSKSYKLLAVRGKFETSKFMKVASSEYVAASNVQLVSDALAAQPSV